MSKSVVVTARIGEETLALVDRIAAAKDRSRAWVIARAIEAQASAEAEFMDLLQVGIEQADRGDLIDHEDFVAELRARCAARRAA